VSLSDLEVLEVFLAFDLLYLSNFTFIFGIEKLKVYNTRTTDPTNKITTKDFTAVACAPNIAFKSSIKGQEIYHQKDSYLFVSQSIIGKFIIQETKIITTKNCFINKFIKYPFDIINIHTSIHKPKNIFNHISQKTTLA